jgi:YfiH family protein
MSEHLPNQVLSDLSLHHPNWTAPEWVRAFTTMRTGGVSQGDYASLNLAEHVGDDPVAVAQNRALLSQAIGKDLHWFWMAQQHTTTVLQAPDDFVTMNTRADDDALVSAPVADAMWTSQPGLVMTTLTADCMPVLFCHRHTPIVAAVHAGWKGLLDGILEQTLQALPGQPADYCAWIGPSILQDNFEVTGDFRADFLTREAAWQDYFKINPDNPSHWLADLPSMAAWVLKSAGVSSIDQSGLCTYEQTQAFYSYRRQATTGRMVTCIWIDPQ